MRQEGEMTLELKKQLGRKIKKPERQFVTLSAWDPKIDGPSDKAKVVTEDLGQGPMEGIWIVTGREGVYGEENYSSELLDETQLEVVSTGLFGKERLRNKRDACKRLLLKVLSTSA